MLKKIFFILTLFLVIFLLYSVQNKPEVIQNSCAGCGDCITYCPVKAIKLENGKALIDANKCINCKICVTTCTFGAIK